VNFAEYFLPWLILATCAALIYDYGLHQLREPFSLSLATIAAAFSIAVLSFRHLV